VTGIPTAALIACAVIVLALGALLSAGESALLRFTRAAADIAPKTWLQQLQTYAAQHGFAEEFERVWTTESWPMKRVAAFQVV